MTLLRKPPQFTLFIGLFMAVVFLGNIHSGNADSDFSILSALSEKSTLSPGNEQKKKEPWVLNPAGDLIILNRPVGLAFDITGKLYASDLLNKRIRIFKEGNPFPEKKQIKGYFSLPWSLDLDRTGNMYITDTGKNQILIISQDPKPKFIGTKGQRPGTFNIPTGICIDEDRQRFLVADFANHVIQILSLDGTYLGHIGKTDRNGLFGKSGRLEGEFCGPSDVDIDSYGRIYVADKENSRFQIFHASGRFIASYGQSGAAKGRFNRPSGICIGPNGDVYICDTFNDRIQILRSPFAGAMEPEFEVIRVIKPDRRSKTGPLKVPNKCVISNDGNLYVSDTGNNRIIVFPLD